MDKITRTNLDNLRSDDADLRYEAFRYVMKVTDDRVEWAYDVWDDLIGLLRRGDNHQRSIAAQVLANLAKSDPKKRMLKDLDALFAVTRDERFVTARHALQSLWRVAAAGRKLQQAVVERLETRFAECVTEKNCTLIRYDIIQVIRRVYELAGDRKVKDRALALLATEEDAKYRKKYASLWRDT
jgi:hypothetical protein